MTCRLWSVWPAPAKLNLFLHIVGRRADGYHLLQTVFQLLDWGDTVRLRVRDDGLIQRVHPLPGVPEETDLTVRAARLLQQTTGCGAGAEIRVDKDIPIGGGLGGGSSDAATVLVVLNRLWNTALNEDALVDLGLTLGADVPVFIRGRSAFAENLGEQLTPLNLPEHWFLIINPQVSAPTRELFQAPELTRNSLPLTIPCLPADMAAYNVFEPVVRARFPAVAQALDWLSAHGLPRLSGSGGCVFLPVASRQAGMELAAMCPVGMEAIVARGVNHSPLMAAMAKFEKV